MIKEALWRVDVMDGYHLSITIHNLYVVLYSKSTFGANKHKFHEKFDLQQGGPQLVKSFGSPGQTSP